MPEKSPPIGEMSLSYEDRQGMSVDLIYRELSSQIKDVAWPLMRLRERATTGLRCGGQRDASIPYHG
jgi:hypothetical protein